VVVEDQSPKQVRFRLFETIRQYAWECLDEAGEIDATRERCPGVSNFRRTSNHRECTTRGTLKT